MLKQRIITAVLIVVALLAALAYLSLPILSAVFALVVLLAAWDWADLSGFSAKGARLRNSVRSVDDSCRVDNKSF